MGAVNKLLLPFRGSTLVEHSADKLLSLNAFEFIVVTGHEAPRVQYHLNDRPFRFTFNPHYAIGMTSSIQQGISECSPNSQGALICLSDMPYLELEDLHQIWATANKAIQEKEKVIVAPFVETRMGNPVFFSRYYFPKILEHKESNGCKSLIIREMEHVVKVSLSNKDAFRDIDVPGDLDQDFKEIP